jgi:hypothetical protein
MMPRCMHVCHLSRIRVPIVYSAAKPRLDKDQAGILRVQLEHQARENLISFPSHHIAIMEDDFIKYDYRLGLQPYMSTIPLPMLRHPPFDVANGLVWTVISSKANASVRTYDEV